MVTSGIRREPHWSPRAKSSYSRTFGTRPTCSSRVGDVLRRLKGITTLAVELGDEPRSVSARVLSAPHADNVKCNDTRDQGVSDGYWRVCGSPHGMVLKWPLGGRRPSGMSPYEQRKGAQFATSTAVLRVLPLAGKPFIKDIPTGARLVAISWCTPASSGAAVRVQIQGAECIRRKGNRSHRRVTSAMTPIEGWGDAADHVGYRSK